MPLPDRSVKEQLRLLSGMLSVDQALGGDLALRLGLPVQDPFILILLASRL